jgi:release factor glutamine methyltransferase
VDTIGSALDAASAILGQAGCREPRRRARQLIAGGLGVTATELLIASDQRLGDCQKQRLCGLVRRLAGGEPLSRVLGRREFWGFEFELSPEVFDPRPETETVVEAVLARVDRNAPLNLLDLGTGSGCLLFALLSVLEKAFGLGIDCSAGAVAVARRNAIALGLACRTRLVIGDWGTAIARPFDVVVSNPPYIASPQLGRLPRAVAKYDPRRALDGGVDGLAAYRAIASDLTRLMAPGALFAAEIGAGQAAAVGAILQQQGLSIEGVERDLAGIERCILARNSP